MISRQKTSGNLKNILGKEAGKDYLIQDGQSMNFQKALSLKREGKGFLLAEILFME